MSAAGPVEVGGGRGGGRAGPRRWPLSCTGWQFCLGPPRSSDRLAGPRGQWPVRKRWTRGVAVAVLWSRSPRPRRVRSARTPSFHFHATPWGEAGIPSAPTSVGTPSEPLLLGFFREPLTHQRDESCAFCLEPGKRPRSPSSSPLRGCRIDCTHALRGRVHACGITVHLTVLWEGAPQAAEPQGLCWH